MPSHWIITKLDIKCEPRSVFTLFMVNLNYGLKNKIETDSEVFLPCSMKVLGVFLHSVLERHN